MSVFMVRNLEFKALIRDSFACEAFMETVGATLKMIELGRVDVEATFDAHITQQHGFIHGGVVGAIADRAAGYAACSLMDDKDFVLTLEYKLNLLVPAKGERILPRAEVMRPERKLTIVRSDVSAFEEEDETLCATAVVTLIRLVGKFDRVTGSHSCGGMDN
jgi:uncharacterized protein (TIGR00369 family)